MFGDYKIYDADDKLVEDRRTTPAGGNPWLAIDTFHAAHFIAAIRSGDHFGLNAEIEKGHRSTLLCHLGNIAYRTAAHAQVQPGERPHPRTTRPRWPSGSASTSRAGSRWSESGAVLVGWVGASQSTERRASSSLAPALTHSTGVERSRGESPHGGRRPSAPPGRPRRGLRPKG